LVSMVMVIGVNHLELIHYTLLKEYLGIVCQE